MTWTIARCWLCPAVDSWGRVRTAKRLPPALYHRRKEYFPMTGRTRSFHMHCVRIPNHAHRGCISFECHCNQNAKMWPGREGAPLRAHDLCKMMVMVSTRVKEQVSLPSQPRPHSGLEGTFNRPAGLLLWLF